MRALIMASVVNGLMPTFFAWATIVVSNTRFAGGSKSYKISKGAIRVLPIAGDLIVPKPSASGARPAFRLQWLPAVLAPPLSPR